MKQTILKIIGRATNKKTVVFNEAGEEVSVVEMEDNKFYCFNPNTLTSDLNKDSWRKFIAENEAPPLTNPLIGEVPLPGIHLDEVPDEGTQAVKKAPAKKAPAKKAAKRKRTRK